MLRITMCAPPANPQSWNRYGYVLNNPANGIDPSGLQVGYGGDGVGDCYMDGLITSCSDVRDALKSGAALPGALAGTNAQLTFSSGNNFIFSYPVQIGTVTSAESYPDDPVLHFGQSPVYGTGQLSINLSAAPVGTDGPANNGTSWWSKYIPKVPVNLTVIVPALGIVGPAVTVTYLPQTHNLCVAPGLGASVGKNVSAGPLILGNLANAKTITEGGSISVGAQVTPFIGAQATGNFSGILGGPTVGIPGGSVTATYGICF